MIKLLAFNKRQFSTKECTVRPTMFPDGTSQIWKLPEEMLSQSEYKIIWKFSDEREIFDVVALTKLLKTYNGKCYINLHIPFLPFARQDKEILNESTFNLKVFARLVNQAEYDCVTSVDVHNPNAVKSLLRNFTNIEVEHIHREIFDQYVPDCVIYPDAGASARYKNYGINYTFFEKTRDQLTGEIIGLKPVEDKHLKENSKFLIIDDICDGGRTFIEVAKEIRKHSPDAKIALFITHGIFSKGKTVLYEAGISDVFTTNSLETNYMGFEV